jgi:hypothetical protein
MEHVSICAKCKDHDFDACSNHVSTIARLNDEIVQLNVQLKTYKNEVEKFKFARNAFSIGRHPSIKDGLGFQKGTKNTKSQKALNFTKEKWKAPMGNSSHSFHERKNHVYLYSHVRNVSHNAHHDIYNDSLLFQSVMMVSLLLALCLLHLVILVGVKLGTMHLMLSLMRLRIGMHLMELLFYSILMTHPM